MNHQQESEGLVPSEGAGRTDKAAPMGKPDQRFGHSGQPRTERMPLTEEDWRALLTVVLGDIQTWSKSRGRDNVPPVEFLRQLMHFVDAMGTLR